MEFFIYSYDIYTVTCVCVCVYIYKICDFCTDSFKREKVFSDPSIQHWPLPHSSDFSQARLGKCWLKKFKPKKKKKKKKRNSNLIL